MVRIILCAVGAAALVTDGAFAQTKARLAPARAATPAAPATSATGEVTAAEIAPIAKQIESGINNGDPAALDQRFNVPKFIASVTDGVAAGPGAKEGFLAGITGADGALIFGAKVVEATSDGGHYRFLRVIDEDGRPSALFRMVHGSGAVNYHKFLFTREKDGLLIDDFFVAITGERMSQTLRRLYVPVALQSAAANTAEAKKTLAGYDRLSKMNQLKQQGNIEQYLAEFEKLPDQLKRDPSVQLSRLMIAQTSGDIALYDRASQETLEVLGNSVAIDLVSIDLLLGAGKFDEVYQAIDRVDQWTGGDPYLQVTRGNIAYAQAKPNVARKHANAALSKERNLYQAHDLLLIISIDEENHAETARLLRIFETVHGLDFGDLSHAEGYEAFRASPEYKQWMNAKKK